MLCVFFLFEYLVMFCSFINILSWVEEVPCTLVCQVGKTMNSFSLKFVIVSICLSSFFYYQHGKIMSTNNIIHVKWFLLTAFLVVIIQVYMDIVMITTCHDFYTNSFPASHKLLGCICLTNYYFLQGWRRKFLIAIFM
jgi:hypothetical protein